MVRRNFGRTSRKRVEELCKLFEMRLVRHQRLGNRKDYYYVYMIIESNGNRVADCEALGVAYRKLVNRCNEIVDKMRKDI